MTATKHENVEARVRELFDRQARTIAVPDRAWEDAPLTNAFEIVAPRRRRPVIALLVAAAASVALIVGIAAVSPTGVRVAGQPGTESPLDFATAQVHLTADGMTIDAGGQRFTAGGSVVDVHSDPGDAKYQTLELTWNERGVEMRLYIYLAADAHDWWATSITTYNGKSGSDADSIEYMGDRFRTPLGRAFTGNVDLAPTDGQAGHLHLSNMHLQPFLPAPACATSTGKYALQSLEGNDITVDGGFGNAVVLLDRLTCRPVPHPEQFVFTWTPTDLHLLGVDVNCFDPKSCSPTSRADLSARASGSLILHVAAKELATGQVVASTDIRITTKFLAPSP